MLSSGFRCAAAILLLALVVSPGFAVDNEPPKPGDPISPRDAAAETVAERAAEASAVRTRWLVTIREYAVVALPKIVIAIVLLLLVYYAIRFVCRRGIHYWSTSGRGTEQQQRDRAKTLISVLDNALYTAMFAIGAIVVLDILKVPVGTLLGGVAVVGLAVAFGAQNLIRDYFSGFMILLEDQYKINDVVTINSMTGTVERLTLRITVLRDFEGKVYFIPNGQITSVINLTHEWSRAVIDVRVGFEQKLERVMSVLLELAEAMHRDPAFAGGILREPELMGVERVEESALVVRLCMVTRPQQKETVRRELLRRIKLRFDELGIATPIPQRIVFYRPEPGEAEPAAPEAARLPESANGPAAPRAAVEEA